MKYAIGQPNAEGAEVSQRTQKEIQNDFWLFFCDFRETSASFATFASGTRIRRRLNG